MAPKYRETSNISRTLVGSKIVDNSDVVGASPVGAAPTTSSFSTYHLASMDWAKTTAWGYKKYLSFGIWCDLYKRFYGISNNNTMVKTTPYACKICNRNNEKKISAEKRLSLNKAYQIKKTVLWVKYQSYSFSVQIRFFSGVLVCICQAIIWTNDGILLIGPLGTNFSEIIMEIQTFSLKKIRVKMSSGKCRPICLGLNVLSLS